MPQTPRDKQSESQRSLGIGAALFGAVALVTVVAFTQRPPPRAPAERPALTPQQQAAANKRAKDYAFLRQDDPAVKTTDLGPRSLRVIDIHEHVQSERDADLLLEAMDRFKIERTCLMASTIYTFTLDNKYGFEGHHDNNAQLLALKKKHPDRFCVFVTLDPLEEGALEKVQGYVKQGADGLKLYIGHGAKHGKGPFHQTALDDERLLPLYAWAEQTQLPLLLHVNLILYFEETVRLLERFPYLRVCIPHFGLHKNTKDRLDRLAWLLKRYPNLYTDISFGWHEFHEEGFRALARWRSRSKKYLTEHADKIMFASDMVIEKTKDKAYVDDTLRSYFQLLENEKLRLFLVPELTMHGLKLGEGALKKIYWDTPARFLMLDERGRLPDRTATWPPEGAPLLGLPPTVPEVVPLQPGEAPKGE
jgi:predicted TIM-barrel fold metal-dependent hydrolase